MKERILITVKAYPTLSQKYGELVCTAGIREDGSWVRLYPVAFLQLNKNQQRYHKYQWLTASITRRASDPRPESFTPEVSSIKLGEIITTTNQWAERCRFVLQRGTVYDDMTQLIKKANSNEISLATYKPSEIINLIAEKADGEWDQGKLDSARNNHMQGDLFAEDDDLGRVFSLVDKLPYKFKYHFRDKDGKERKLMIEDWEIGALYWNCLKDAEGDESVALQKVREKYLDDFARNRDLYLFVGTTKMYHGWASNPFVIIGTFTPPKNRNLELNFWK